MARTTKNTKKAPAPATPAPEATKEAHLDPGQFADMDDANLQQLARDMGLDPAAYADREALIAAIAAVPVIPGPPEGEAEQPDHAPAPEPTADPEPEQQQDPAPPTEDPEPDPAGERHTPYKATVAVSLAVLHKAVGVGTADMLKAVGTLRQGTEVTVTGRKGTYAQLKNGLYILEAFLEVRPIS